MPESPLRNKAVLITGASRRVGRTLALASAEAGADVIIQYRTSRDLAESTRKEVESMGRGAWILRADLRKPDAVPRLAEQAFKLAPVFGLVNSAAIFAGSPLWETSPEDWETHLAINLTAPFLLLQAFTRLRGTEREGRLVNLLVWPALRTGTGSFFLHGHQGCPSRHDVIVGAIDAPHISVNGPALGAFLPPQDEEPNPEIVSRIPARRWGEPSEAGAILVYLLARPAYLTGEIIHVDGGRHLL